MLAGILEIMWLDQVIGMDAMAGYLCFLVLVEEG
jgi:hypothetical protein